MNPWELTLCLSSLACSSASQLFIKGAVLQSEWRRKIIWLGLAGCLLLVSVGLAVITLKTLPLSKLLPFAAASHLLVPFGSSYFFGDRLYPHFWVGVFLIISGILCVLA
ncbi:MAG: hypothetical protein ACN6QY_10110 [Pseudomonas sp.]|uniref:hypothetical protein n=1 Tax=Pseudomonas sp. TaxID=306 RepID=UPI003D0C9116